ncbi:33793_t:CDS:1, partial [Racocetra persica]
FNKLKKLVKLLEEAHGTPTSNTKQELEQFISESKNNAEQKKALDIAKKVKN